MNGERSDEAPSNNSLSILSNQGLLATTQLPQGKVSPPSSSGKPALGDSNDRSEDSPSSPPDLDFIGSGPAVKTLFSIPISETPVCVAVHNLDGTLLIDEVVPEHEQHEQTHQQHHHGRMGDGTSEAFRLSPSRQSLAMALSPRSTAERPTQQTEALSLLSQYVESLQEDHPSSDAWYRHQHNLPQSTQLPEGSSSSSSGQDPSDQSFVRLPPSLEAAPFREYWPWKFQEMNLLVGSDALVVRPPESETAGVLVRVEEVQYLQRLLDLQRPRPWLDQTTAPSSSASSPPTLVVEAPKSYAQALRQPSPASLGPTTTDEDPHHEKPPLNLDQVRLQTCIVPKNDPLEGWRQSPTTTTNPSETPSTKANPKTSLSPKCLVLDAYLDNLMANVPQLALCLQEKGLIQSVKLLHKDQIPSMMIHPQTLDTSLPVETVTQTNPSLAPDLFSPEIMEMNATALLRFLKANCTQNNTTYLLRTSNDGGANNQNNIQLYDISSISQQRQKKWIWWLATMSYRFALRLRQLEASDVLPMRQRAFRQRQRSLLQTTLDLLQDLLDMDGKAHESLVASVREHMADTFLGGETGHSSSPTEGPSDEAANHPPPPGSTPPPVMSSSPPKSLSMMPPPTSTSPVPRRRLSSSQNLHPKHSTHRPQSPQPQPPPQKQSPQHPPLQDQNHQPYSTISTDALNKAQDHLVLGIKALRPVLQDQIEPRSPPPSKAGSRRRKRNQTGSKPSSQFREEEENDDVPSPATVSQLFGLNYKLVNVSLRLAQHYLRQYSSSSAMQALRHAARRMADSIALLQYLTHPGPWIQRLRLQYTWLWEHCGHFARSFASDELWRDRGHATGDDVLYVLRDVEAAFSTTPLPFDFSNLPDPLRTKTKGLASLHSLSGVCSSSTLGVGGTMKKDAPILEQARKILASENLLQRDKRQVLVASCISYSRAIVAFHERTESVKPADSKHVTSEEETTILNLLRQRLGDACNETGKALLASVRTLLTTKPSVKPPGVADALLNSAHFWFLEGLKTFEACRDFPNIALLRCNLCQCWKLRANASFISRATSEASHAEVCLEEAAGHLQAAHETLGQREVDSRTWDMVSEELAATFLVLAVRRRQSLLGGGNAPVVFEALRLSPGKERSIIEPMEKALSIYQQSGNYHQAAAVHYQLALTNSKVWTCQRDEAKTREKLSAAFQQYNQAFAYFSNHLGGNEPTFVLLCLDIASLYAAVSGEECLVKALTRCLDTSDAFSKEAVDRSCHSQEWLQKMGTLAVSVEDRVFKLLRNLVKLEADAPSTDASPTRWKDLYREGLASKMVRNVSEMEVPGPSNDLLALHDVLNALRTKFYAPR